MNWTSVRISQNLDEEATDDEGGEDEESKEDEDDE
jgi:hypothetical protein